MQVDINDTAALERRVEEDTAAFGKYVDGLLAGLNQKRDRLEADMRTRVERANSDDQTTLRQMLQRDIDQTISEARREVVELSKDDRAKRIERMDEADQQLAVLESLNKGPQQVLARLHSGDPKKATYLSVLEKGGPGALQTHMELSLATGDRALASAVLIVNDNLKTNQRPFSSATFAEKMVGQEVAATQQKLAELRHKILSARELNTEFARGENTALNKIERGMRQWSLAGKKTAHDGKKAAA